MTEPTKATPTPTKMKLIGFEVTEQEWIAIKKKCIETGNNIRTLFRPYVTALVRGKENDGSKK